MLNSRYQHGRQQSVYQYNKQTRGTEIRTTSLLLFLIIKHLSATALFAGLFQTLGVLRDLELVDAFLDVTVHKDRKVVH